MKLVLFCISFFWLNIASAATWTIYLKHIFEDKRVSTLKIVSRADEALTQREWPYEKTGDKRVVKFDHWPQPVEIKKKKIQQKKLEANEIRCDCRWLKPEKSKEDLPRIELSIKCEMLDGKSVKEIIPLKNFEYRRATSSQQQGQMTTDNDLAQQIAMTIATLPYP